MTDESVVVDDGQTYVSEETAEIAKQAMNQAKQWAEESERQANIATGAADDAIDAKDYAQAAITDTNLITVATDLQSPSSDIKRVSTHISNVNTVATNIASVLATGQNIASVNTAAANIVAIQNAASNAQKARDWAIKTDGRVDNVDYSAKYYALQAAALFGTLSPVATSGSYNDLSNKPTIPTKTSDLTNDSGYVTQTTADSTYARLAGVNTFTGTIYVPDVNIIAAPGAYAANTKYVQDYVGTSILHLYSYGSEIGRFSANATSDVRIDLDIPTRVSQLTDADAYATQVWVSATYATKTEVTTAISTKADDSNTVHKTGNETIGGVKTFSSDTYISNNQPFLYLRQTNFDKGDVPESQIAASINFIDGSGVLSGTHQLSSIGTEILTSGAIRCFLRAFKNAVGVSDNAQIAVYYPTTGDAYTECIAPTENTTTSKQIDTVGARNTAIANKQDTLVSGTNIKTINNISLLGSGNIDIQGGGGSYTAGTGIDITNSVISADIATSVSSASTNSQSVGAKLFYDTVGDIETLLSQV